MVQKACLGLMGGVALPLLPVLAALGLVTALPVVAQVVPVEHAPPIKNFDVGGEDPLPANETVQILKRYLHRPANVETVNQVIDELEATLRRRDLHAFRVVLPPQLLSETIRLQVVRMPGLATVAQAPQPQTIKPQPSQVAPSGPGAPGYQPPLIRGFDINGENPLTEGQTTQALAQFLRKPASLETLQQATAKLESALRERGFGLYRVALVPQPLSEVVRLQIVHFKLAEVQVQGNQQRDEANIKASVPELSSGKTPNLQRMAVQTAMANENPSKSVQVSLKESTQPDQVDAVIKVEDKRPWSITLSANNSGSAPTGHDRVSVAAGHSNLWNADHQIGLAYTTSAQNPSQVHQYGLTYRAPIYRSLGMVSASFVKSDVVGNFATFTSTGAGSTANVSYTAYLNPEGARRSYVVFGLDDKVYEALRLNNIILPGQVPRRSRLFSLGYVMREDAEARQWALQLDAVANTGAGSHNDLASYQNEDPRIRSVYWKALRGQASYAQRLGGNWLLAVRGQFQVSRYALLAGEQFGLGGAGSVRGTGVERPISGDRGALLSVEMTSSELATGLRAAVFLDAGWLANHTPNANTKPAHDRLASAGLGLRYNSNTWTVQADYARLLNGSVVPLGVNSNAPQKGDDKLHLNMSIKF